ncbi:hypothetical protein PIB30_111277, partial [Stylosanthes scabra]|nr:hypothetical protein [Stylosanthes scabra]
QPNDVIRLTKQILYVESSAAATVINGSYVPRGTFYVSGVDKTLQELALGDSCRIEWMYLTSWPVQINNSSISSTDLHNMLLYGFELSWLKGYCNNETYFAMIDDHNNIVCFNSPYKESPLQPQN